MNSHKDNLQSIAPFVFLTAMSLSPLIGILWFIVGIFFFGIITGPTPTLQLWFLYTIFSLFPTAFMFAHLLRSQLKAHKKYLTYQQAFMLSLISLSFIHASIGIITLTQFADGAYDGITALIGFLISISTLTILTTILSKPVKAGKIT